MKLFKRPQIRTFEERVKQAILSMGAICYVRINSKDEFFLFKKAGAFLEYAQDLGELCEGWDVQRWGVLSSVSKTHSMNACYILHGDNLIYRNSSNLVVSKEKFVKAGFGELLKRWIKSGDAKDITATQVEVLLADVDLDWQDLNDKDIDKVRNLLIEASRGEVDDIYLSKYAKQIKQVRSALILTTCSH